MNIRAFATKYTWKIPGTIILVLGVISSIYSLVDSNRFRGDLNKVPGVFGALIHSVVPLLSSLGWPAVGLLLIWCIKQMRVVSVGNANKCEIHARTFEHFNLLSLRVRKITKALDSPKLSRPQFTTLFHAYIRGIDQSMKDFICLLNNCFKPLKRAAEGRLEIVGIHYCCSCTPSFFYEFSGECGDHENEEFRSRLARTEQRPNRPPIFSLLEDPQMEGLHLASSLLIYLSTDPRDLSDDDIPPGFFGISIKSVENVLGHDLAKWRTRSIPTPHDLDLKVVRAAESIQYIPPKIWKNSLPNPHHSNLYRVSVSNAGLRVAGTDYVPASDVNGYTGYNPGDYTQTALSSFLKPGLDHSKQKLVFTRSLLEHIYTGLCMNALCILGSKRFSAQYIYYKAINLENIDACAVYFIAAKPLKPWTVEEIFSLTFPAALSITKQTNGFYWNCPATAQEDAETLVRACYKNEIAC